MIVTPGLTRGPGQRDANLLLVTHWMPGHARHDERGGRVGCVARAYRRDLCSRVSGSLERVGVGLCSDTQPQRVFALGPRLRGDTGKGWFRRVGQGGFLRETWSPQQYPQCTPRLRRSRSVVRRASVARDRAGRARDHALRESDLNLFFKASLQSDSIRAPLVPRFTAFRHNGNGRGRGIDLSGTAYRSFGNRSSSLRERGPRSFRNGSPDFREQALAPDSWMHAASWGRAGRLTS